MRKGQDQDIFIIKESTYTRTKCNLADINIRLMPLLLVFMYILT